MARVKRGVAAHARHKKVLKLAKGYRGRSSTCFRPALERVERAWQYAYRDRKVEKRRMRALWIQRINAAVRALGEKYSTFMNGLARANIQMDRKILAKFAVENPEVIAQLVARIKGTHVQTAGVPEFEWRKP
jgi:large subunit ribosomal protein L20